MRSALVNENTNIVENIIVADSVLPSPFIGYLMIGLIDPVYEDRIVTQSVTFPSDATITYNVDGSTTVILIDGTKINYPIGAIVTTNPDGTFLITYTITETIEVTPGTPCDVDWIYDPITGQFNPSNNNL